MLLSNSFILKESDAMDKIVKTTDKMKESIEGYLPKIVDFGIRILIAIVILILGRILIRFLMKLLSNVFDKTKIEISVRKFLISICRVISYLILIIILCSQIGIDTTSFIAVLSSAGLAIGLAMQGSLSNFAGGVLILINKPFLVGDYIIDEGTGKEGTVKKIDLFYTSLITGDNKSVIIPNGILTNSAITNVTSQDKRRIDIEIGVSYNSNTSEVKKILEKLVNEEEKVLKNEEIFVYIKELTPNQVTVGIRAWVKTGDYWVTYCTLTEKVKLCLDENGIEIPFNQLKVHISP